MAWVRFPPREFSSRSSVRRGLLDTQEAPGAEPGATIWACSSFRRAPALQAGGGGGGALQVHVPPKFKKKNASLVWTMVPVRCRSGALRWAERSVAGPSRR